ncbi:hypothetical protein GCM10010252_06670 [Streptomyces aureoverticillatus]|nr:hypothetical protein GCM10010252_06670 [Streptomyces aureoverticillatus]
MTTQRATQYRRRLGLVAVAVITTVSLAACGGGSGKKSGRSGGPGGSSESSEAPKNLKLGQAGPEQEITSYKKTAKFSITPTKVTEGKPADLKELGDDKKYKGKKVAWIYVKAKHVGGAPAIKSAMVMGDVSAETTAGAPATKFILIGSLSSQPADCLGNNGKKELGGEDIWKKGEERTVCEPYLIPATEKVKAVTYSQGFYKEPLKWAVR